MIGLKKIYNIMETTKRKRFSINTFNLGEPLSKRIRLRIYKEALQYLKDGRDSRYEKKEPAGLCLILPYLLFKFPTYLSYQPNGNIWSFKDTENSFPELKSFLEAHSGKIIERVDRIKFLEETIEQLS